LQCQWQRWQRWWWILVHTVAGHQQRRTRRLATRGPSRVSNPIHPIHSRSAKKTKNGVWKTILIDVIISIHLQFRTCGIVDSEKRVWISYCSFRNDWRRR
jgi:hypothetical protein